MLISSSNADNMNPIESARGEAERFVQSTLDALSSHIAILNDHGSIIGVNASWRKFAENNGFTGQSFGIGMNYLAVCDAATARKSQDAPVVALGIREIMSGKLSEFEMEYPCHSPIQRRWFVVRVSKFKWYGEARMIVAHQNVTELKRVQIELEESKRRIEAILDNINNGIVTVDPMGRIETSNRAAANIFGYSLDEMIGISIADLVDEPIDNKMLQHLNGQYGHEITGCRSDGTRFPAYFSFNELKLDDGSLYTCIIQDITYRKRMEAEIIERERVTVALEKERELRHLKNRFMSMMGHELKTPLAQISLANDMMKKYGDVAPPEDREQYLETIQTQVKHLDGMIEDVLTLSRNEAGRLYAELEDVDLITYCRDVVEEFQFSYHRTHQVEFECPENILRASIDRKLLRRALTNLISNAIKYSPDGGRVDFMLQREGNDAVICVKDSGIGIPKADQKRLFEPFHRAANVDTLPGTGLGLAITRQAIELHSGTIDFKSKPDQGTTFIVRFPLCRPEIEGGHAAD